MAVQTRAYLKSRFKAGDHPTAQDFIDLVDSMMLSSDDQVALRNEPIFHHNEIVTLGAHAQS
jgi:hypothetical protein